jgi:hypothetical protein
MADPFHDFSATSFGGVPAAQYFSDFLLWEIVLNSNPQLLGIVELGTFRGGMSRFLYAQAEARGLAFLTFDVIEPDEPAPNFEKIDIYRFSGELAQRFKKMGAIALFCDGGNKARELRTFPPELEPGSIALVHDWGTEMLPEYVPDFLEELYGDYCDEIGSVTRVFRMKEE